MLHAPIRGAPVERTPRAALRRGSGNCAPPPGVPPLTPLITILVMPINAHILHLITSPAPSPGSWILLFLACPSLPTLCARCIEMLNY